jgi:hypothetical protein
LLWRRRGLLLRRRWLLLLLEVSYLRILIRLLLLLLGGFRCGMAAYHIGRATNGRSRQYPTAHSSSHDHVTVLFLHSWFYMPPAALA